MKRKIAYIAVWVILLVYLFSINQIIAAVKPTAKYVAHNPLTLINQDVNYSMEVPVVLYDLFDSISCSGWAFVETSKDNSQKQIGIALVGEEASYLFSDKSYIRNDVYGAFASSHNIQGSNHGFELHFSTVGLDVGKYKVAVYDYENDADYGLVYTSYMLVKDSNGVTISPFVSSQVKGSVSVDAEGGMATIDSNQCGEDGSVFVSGWGYIPNFDSSKQSVYVQLIFEDGTTKVFDTLPISRPDVTEVFQNELYDMSGFQALIPQEELFSANYEVAIMISDGDTVYSTQSPWA